MLGMDGDGSCRRDDCDLHSNSHCGRRMGSNRARCCRLDGIVAPVEVAVVASVEPLESVVSDRRCACASPSSLVGDSTPRDRGGDSGVVRATALWATGSVHRCLVLRSTQDRRHSTHRCADGGGVVARLRRNLSRPRAAQWLAPGPTTAPGGRCSRWVLHSSWRSTLNPVAAPVAVRCRSRRWYHGDLRCARLRNQRSVHACAGRMPRNSSWSDRRRAVGLALSLDVLLLLARARQRRARVMSSGSHLG